MTRRIIHTGTRSLLLALERQLRGMTWEEMERRYPLGLKNAYLRGFIQWHQFRDFKWIMSESGRRALDKMRSE